MEHLVKLELSFSSLVLSCISGCIIIHEHLSCVFLKKRHASLNCNRHAISGGALAKRSIIKKPCIIGSHNKCYKWEHLWKEVLWITHLKLVGICTVNFVRLNSATVVLVFGLPETLLVEHCCVLVSSAYAWFLRGLLSWFYCFFDLPATILTYLFFSYISST